MKPIQYMFLTIAFFVIKGLCRMSASWRFVFNVFSCRGSLRFLRYSIYFSLRFSDTLSSNSCFITQWIPNRGSSETRWAQAFNIALLNVNLIIKILVSSFDASFLPALHDNCYILMTNRLDFLEHFLFDLKVVLLPFCKCFDLVFEEMIVQEFRYLIVVKIFNEVFSLCF